LKGWLHPTLTAIFITIKPPGQDAEMMGVFLFSCYGFAWLPPLTFTLINELGLTAGWALVSLTMFYLLGLVCLYVMGNYAGAIEAVHPHDGRTSSDLAEELPDDEPEENESLIKRLIR
jgi:predicted membrane channel-forming protein YqfA (hemolysin III family)